ncbi:MAG: hypothetical protein WBP12_04680 [Candidatus Saccharimonas sp.]
MKRALHLQHHRHTGKVLAHKHTSYRGLFLLVALFSLSLIAIVQSVRANDIIATAKVAAPIPATAAQVTSHDPEAVSATDSIELAGSCSYAAPTTVVEVHADGQFVASGVCSPSNTFAIPLILSPGRHLFILRTVNVTNDYGPDSNPTFITYAPSATTQEPQQTESNQPTNTGSTVTSGANGLRIYSKSTYLLFGPDKDAEWVGYFAGGVPPYRVAIDWGDGTSSTYLANDSGQQSYRHTYTSYRPLFATISVRDDKGTTVVAHIAAITPYAESSTGLAYVTGGESARINQIFLYVGYGTLATLVLLAALTIYHAEFSYPHPRPVAKQYIRPKHTPRKRR